MQHHLKSSKVVFYFLFSIDQMGITPLYHQSWDYGKVKFSVGRLGKVHFPFNFLQLDKYLKYNQASNKSAKEINILYIKIYIHWQKAAWSSWPLFPGRIPALASTCEFAANKSQIRSKSHEHIMASTTCFGQKWWRCYYRV